MVQFGEQLDGVIHEPWRDHYIQYNRLKRIITRNRFILDSKSLRSVDTTGAGSLTRSLSITMVTTTEMIPLSEKAVSPSKAENDINESTPLNIGLTRNDTMQALVDEGFDINLQEKTSTKYSMEDFFAALWKDVEKINSFFIAKMDELQSRFDEISSKRGNSYRLHHTGGDLLGDLKEYRSLYKELSLLLQFCDYNKTGFVKIVKKHDKVMKLKDLDDWKLIVNKQLFSVSLRPHELMEALSDIVGRDNLLLWEKFRTQETSVNSSSSNLFTRVRPVPLGVSVGVFLLSLLLPMFPFDLAASRCFSILILAIFLWVSEALPYYTTALMLCPLVVIMRVLKGGNQDILSASEAAALVYSSMWNHTSVLLLGGYTISSAFSRCQLELRLASFMQKRLGDHPKLFILAVMLLGLFLSTWISNTTAPILVSSFVTPIVRDLPTKSKFSKCLLLGLAVACNIGGMMTPISSMQNALAASSLQASGYEVSFGAWICVSLPLCLVLTILSWFFLINVVNPDDVERISTIVYERDNMYSSRNVLVISLSLITICLLAISTILVGEIGDIGIISLVFIVSMYGSGVLSEVDFNSLSWHTLFLIGGGNVLGEAVTSSGLLNYISSNIVDVLPMNFFWPALGCILIFALTVATFVSHTVAAIILIPLIVQLGVTLGNPIGVTICSVFAISAAQALPFSSFPNVNSFLTVDDLLQPYLTVSDFLATGLPLSFIFLLIIATMGSSLINILMV